MNLPDIWYSHKRGCLDLISSSNAWRVVQAFDNCISSLYWKTKSRTLTKIKTRMRLRTKTKTSWLTISWRCSMFEGAFPLAIWKGQGGKNEEKAELWDEIHRLLKSTLVKYHKCSWSCHHPISGSFCQGCWKEKKQYPFWNVIVGSAQYLVQQNEIQETYFQRDIIMCQHFSTFSIHQKSVFVLF